VPPAELEALLLTHPSVMDAAVVARADPVAGEVPVAFVTLKAGAADAPADIADWVAAKVAPHKKLRSLDKAVALASKATHKSERKKRTVCAVCLEKS
jgi:4-coumarate--CoA ligase